MQPSKQLESVISHQIEVMQQQLDVLQGRGKHTVPAPGQPGERDGRQAARIETPASKRPKTGSALPPWRVAEVRARGLRPEQQRHLEDLITRYTAKTRQSKHLTQRYRPVLADNRASAGFRLSIKEMVYPIFGERAQGARTWDIDGNQYIDLTMGFGVNLFGHHPAFVMEALAQQMGKSMQLGLQTPLAGEAAALICELTGMERVTFCNTGTEAVMTALRLARTATGRHKVASFSMSYHGHFDGVLGEAQGGNEQPQAVPAAPGIPPHMVSDFIVLEYGNPHSLEIIRAHAHELAAVLVEPVQSRRPDLQPKAFLQQLRQLTLEENVPLIFDEMITGFRVHPGGVQAWWGIQADVATYGKIVGGGMPIGIIAGKAAYMDGIDGGVWAYGDASYPQANTTLFAGTFGKHPLAMATACAVLKEIKKQGLPLYEQLNQRTAYLAKTLNDYFEQEEMPIGIVHCASLFRFSYAIDLELLYYHLLDKGVYIWEGRNCFLSTAHTDADVAYVIQAIQESLQALRQGGFLPATSTRHLKTNGASPSQAAAATPHRALPDKLSFVKQPPLDYVLSPHEIEKRLLPSIEAWRVQPEVLAYRELLVELERLSLTYVVHACRDMGWSFYPQQRFSTVSMARQLGIGDTYHPLLVRLLEMFAEAGWLRQVAAQWEVILPPEAPDTPGLRARVNAMVETCPAAAAEVALLDRCATHLADVLQGRIDPLGLLFPEGDATLVTQVYQHSPGARCFNTLLQQTVTAALVRLPPERRVRILEMGAGTGAATAYVLPHLPAQQTDYVFSDIHPGFLAHAQTTFRAYPFVHYHVVDVEQPPEAQHIDGGQFDLVMAVNVLHATRDLRQVVRHIYQLLVPGGVLVCMEGTTKQRWLDLIFGLTAGWWRFADHALRPSYPLISTAQWQALLSANGFDDVVGLSPTRLPQEPQDTFSHTAVMVAKRRM
jgi:glutamate-1-semialdehyde aminotransferase/SAM-dependent methyltransferase